MLMKYNEEHARALIGKVKWIWAKTYLSVPHEYIVRGKCGLTDEDLRSVCLVQLRFIRSLLYRQKLHLEAIMFWTPTRLLLNDEISSSREYSAMMVAHDKLAHDVEMIREK